MNRCKPPWVGEMCVTFRDRLRLRAPYGRTVSDVVIPLALLVLGSLAAVAAPGLLARVSWPDREPVLALWVWQCVVAAVLLCCLLATALLAAAGWQPVRGELFGPAPHPGVEQAYSLPASNPWAGALALLLAAGGGRTAVRLAREVRLARAGRRERRAELRTRSPRLPGERPGTGDRLTVLECQRPDAWWLPGSPPQLVVTTGALRRLTRRQLDAVLAHERGHARARHHWLQYCSAALATGFPRVPVFTAFREQVHRLVELAADDAAARRVGRLTTALALLGLNEDRAAFTPRSCTTDPPSAPRSGIPQRVHRLLGPAPRLPVTRRLRVTVAASLAPAVPLLVTFLPGLTALG